MLIDLSILLNENTPVYPGDESPKFAENGTVAKNGVRDHNFTINNHTGTHIDAPSHMIDGGKNLNDFPIDTFVGRGVVLDIADGNFDLDKVKEQNPQAGDIVLFYTGMSNAYADQSYFEEYPEMPKNVAMYLVEQKISMVGTDSCSPDYPDFPIHKILLGGDVLIIENLTGIEKLIGKKFKVYALPLNLNIDGSPARVMAEI